MGIYVTEWSSDEGPGRHFSGKNPHGSCSLELCRRALYSSLPKKGRPALAKQLAMLYYDVHGFGGWCFLVKLPSM